MGSIEIPIDRAYSDKQHIELVRIAIHLYKRSWSSK
jgi:hypothetical protein